MAARWLALESNPDVMNKFLHVLGLDTSSCQFVDVYGVDPDLLMMVPKPVYALMLLFPITENYEKYRLEEEKKINEAKEEANKNVFFMKQTVGNACGTIAILHSIANNMNRLPLKDGPLKTFLNSCSGLSSDEKAANLEFAEFIAKSHEESALQGQTKAPDINEKVNLHFVAFIHKDGHLYELDGRKPIPINHGATTPDTLLEDAAVVCKTFMKRDPTSLEFNMIALAST